MEMAAMDLKPNLEESVSNKFNWTANNQLLFADLPPQKFERSFKELTYTDVFNFLDSCGVDCVLNWVYERDALGDQCFTFNLVAAWITSRDIEDRAYLGTSDGSFNSDNAMLRTISPTVFADGRYLDTVARGIARKIQLGLNPDTLIDSHEFQRAALIHKIVKDH